MKYIWNGKTDKFKQQPSHFSQTFPDINMLKLFNTDRFSLCITQNIIHTLKAKTQPVLKSFQPTNRWRLNVLLFVSTLISRPLQIYNNLLHPETIFSDISDIEAINDRMSSTFMFCSAFSRNYKIITLCCLCKFVSIMHNYL